MQKIIEDIYYGRLSVSEQTYQKGSQYDETLSEVVKLAEDLQKLLLSEHQDTARHLQFLDYTGQSASSSDSLYITIKSCIFAINCSICSSNL